MGGVQRFGEKMGLSENNEGDPAGRESRTKISKWLRLLSSIAHETARRTCDHEYSGLAILLIFLAWHIANHRRALIRIRLGTGTSPGAQMTQKLWRERRRRGPHRRAPQSNPITRFPTCLHHAPSDRHCRTQRAVPDRTAQRPSVQRGGTSLRFRRRDAEFLERECSSGSSFGQRTDRRCSPSRKRVLI
jgi:hypothetical protein